MLRHGRGLTPMPGFDVGGTDYQVRRTTRSPRFSALLLNMSEEGELRLSSRASPRPEPGEQLHSAPPVLRISRIRDCGLSSPARASSRWPSLLLPPRVAGLHRHGGLDEAVLAHGRPDTSPPNIFPWHISFHCLYSSSQPMFPLKRHCRAHPTGTVPYMRPPTSRHEDAGTRASRISRAMRLLQGPVDADADARLALIAQAPTMIRRFILTEPRPDLLRPKGLHDTRRPRRAVHDGFAIFICFTSTFTICSREVSMIQIGCSVEQAQARGEA